MRCFAVIELLFGQIALFQQALGMEFISCCAKVAPHSDDDQPTDDWDEQTDAADDEDDCGGRPHLFDEAPDETKEECGPVPALVDLHAISAMRMICVTSQLAHI